ncbi:MAG TPA: sulfotransferase domain-containing protein, partial [Burkholderiales bacterium]|nr:sulfotransferase domain-containing protein [Burkholderiales bacterium]
RGGTTTLFHYLRQHPEIFIPQRKEVHFFDDDKLWRDGQADYARYHAAFARAAAGRLLGEATPIYMYWEPALARIRDYNPAMKLIMLLRNPVTRAHSDWNFVRTESGEPLSFHEALAAEPERTRQAAPGQLRFKAYVGRGMYTQQLARIWSFFPREQTLVLPTDDLSRALAPMFARIASFLGVAHISPARAPTKAR